MDGSFQVLSLWTANRSPKIVGATPPLARDQPSTKPIAAVLSPEQRAPPQLYDQTFHDMLNIWPHACLQRQHAEPNRKQDVLHMDVQADEDDCMAAMVRWLSSLVCKQSLFTCIVAFCHLQKPELALDGSGSCAVSSQANPLSQQQLTDTLL